MKCSIIIRVFNAEKTVGRAIESALNQDFSKEEFEIVIINDGSTDGSADVLSKYVKYPNVRIHSQENLKGIVAANKGFKMSKGRYVTLLDSDDYFEPDLLKKLSEMLDNNPELDFVYPDYYEKSVGGEVRTVSPKNIFETVSVGTMYKKESLAEEGFFHLGLDFAEYDLMIRTYGKWKSRHCDEPLFTYVRRGDSSTASGDFLRVAIEQLAKLYPDKSELIGKIRKY